MVVRSSSQNCANCGRKVQKSLATRTHVCHHCGLVEYRDINASINILTFVGHTGTYATGDLPSWAIGVNLSSNGESGRISASLDRGVSKIILAKYALDRLKMKIMDN
jgi:putative transposase